MQKLNKYLSISIIISIINLGLLYFIKYSQNNLGLSDFSIFKTGNFISLIFTLLLVFGIILYSQKVKRSSLEHSKLIFLFSAIYFLPLLLNILLSITDFNYANEYLFGYPFKKIIPLIFFIINQTVFLFVLVLAWYLAFGYSVKSYFYSIFLVVILIISFLLFSFLYTFNINRVDFKQEKAQFDFGIILGAAVWSGNVPSPIFKGRIKKGAELYKEKIIKKIHLTGGNAPGEISEAKAAQNYLITNYKIPAKDILIEESTSTTNEQLSFIKHHLIEQKRRPNFLIISDEFHLKRIQEIADFYNIDAQVIPSDIILNFEKSLYYRLRDSIGLIFFWLFAI